MQIHDVQAPEDIDGTKNIRQPDCASTTTIVDHVQGAAEPAGQAPPKPSPRTAQVRRIDESNKASHGDPLKQWYVHRVLHGEVQAHAEQQYPVPEPADPN